MTDSERIYVVDRVEGRGAEAVVVVVTDDDTQMDISRQLLGKLAVEGAVLRVPIRAGQPDWSSATRDRDEERRRLAEAEALLKRLSANDSGGDLEL